MIKISISGVDKTNFILQLLFGAIVVLACVTSKVLMFAAIIISVVYLFSNANWEQKFAFFMFALSFSFVFKFSPEQTSLFMFLRVAIVFSYAFQNNKHFNTNFLVLLLGTFIYTVTLAIFFETDFLVSVINMVLWILIGYTLLNTVPHSKTTPVAISFSNGILITGVISLFVEQLPQLNSMLSVLTLIAEDGALVSRYAGLMPDPNYFTVLVVSALWFVYYEFNKEKISIVEFIIRCAFMSFFGLITMSKSCAFLLLIFWIYVFLAKNNIKLSAKVVLFFSLIVAMMIFIWKNPYWIYDLLYRFTGSNDEFSADIFTTGRSELWRLYREKISDGFRWIYGYGLGAKLISGKAPHNTILQLVYNFGVVGTVLVAMLIRSIYISALGDFSKHRSGRVSRYAFFSLLLSLMFLDGLQIELFYYMMFMCLVYMTEDTNKQRVNSINLPAVQFSDY